MAYSQTLPRGRSFPALVLIGLVLLIVGGTGTMGTLLALGIVENPFSKKPAANATPSNEGKVPVPISAVAVPAYSAVTRDHLIDLAAKELKVIWLRPEEVIPEMITNPSKIVGRVMMREKKPGFAFTERDFFPIGTKAGITAGIPPGKFSFVLPVEKIPGIADLQPGDRFDIVGSLAVDDKKNSLSNYPKDLVNGHLVVGPNGQPFPPKRAVVRSLVTNGVVLMPPTIRQVPTGTMSAKGATPKTKAVHEITIAIDSDEVAVLADAIKVDASLTCVARSGQVGGNTDTETPIVAPKQNGPTVKVKAIETIVNGKRQVLYFGERGEPLEEPSAEMIPVIPRPIEQE
jgi:Flp pilus assembly protein CpaB